MFHFRNRIHRTRQYFIVRTEKLRITNTHWNSFANCKECWIVTSRNTCFCMDNILYVIIMQFQWQSVIIAQSKNNDSLEDFRLAMTEVTETSWTVAGPRRRNVPSSRPLWVTSHPLFWQRLNMIVLEFVAVLFYNVCFGTRFLSVSLLISTRWPNRPFPVQTNSVGAGNGALTRKPAHVRMQPSISSSGAYTE